MKWLLPMAFGSVVVALAVSLPGAQDTISAPDDPNGRAKSDESTPVVAGPETGDAQDAKRDAGGSDSQSTDSERGAGAADGDEVKIFRLRKSDASASRDVILQL